MTVGVVGRPGSVDASSVLNSVVSALAAGGAGVSGLWVAASRNISSSDDRGCRVRPPEGLVGGGVGVGGGVSFCSGRVGS